MGYYKEMTTTPDERIVEVVTKVFEEMREDLKAEVVHEVLQGLDLICDTSSLDCRALVFTLRYHGSPISTTLTPPLL